MLYSDIFRWQIDVTSTRHLGLRIPNKTFYMYNYMSVGVDAQVALSFHKTRDSVFYVYGSRLFNKVFLLPSFYIQIAELCSFSCYICALALNKLSQPTAKISSNDLTYIWTVIKYLCLNWSRLLYLIYHLGVLVSICGVK